jgi:hypothetical protein
VVWREQVDDLLIDWRKTVRKTLGIMIGAVALSTAAIGMMAVPSGATTIRAVKGSFTQTGVYIPDNLAPGEYLIKNTNSQAGLGAGISHVNDVAGTVTDMDYFANGSVKMSSTLHHGSASATGLPISGTGACSHGTGIFAGLTCTYTYTGTLDQANGTVTVKITGTFKKWSKK